MGTLRFVLGRAGSGKTTHMLQALAHDLERGPKGPRLLYIVPEQATFQAESALLETLWRDLGRRGFARADVLSFQRLAWRVLHEVGGPVLPLIGELGGWMVLRSLIEAETPRLRLFHRLADRPGFLRCLASSLAELRDYGHVAALARGLPPASSGTADELLSSKIHDLVIMANRYEEFIADRFTDPRDVLREVARAVTASAQLAGARVYVDGFTGFTPPEFGVLEALLRRAATMEVALCLDGRELAAGEASEEDLFHPTRCTHDELVARARAAGARVMPPVLLPQGRSLPRFRSPALAHVEAGFFRDDTPVMDRPVSGLELVFAATRRIEVEACAREILRLCREEGLRLREIAILVRDLDAYRDLGRVLAAHGIPAFVDARRPVGHHPLVELVRSALETALERWSAEPFLRCLKTDLLAVSRDDADELEAYILEFGITGARLRSTRPWFFRRRSLLDGDDEVSEDDQARLRRIHLSHLAAVGPLARFTSRVAGARLKPWPVVALTEALHALLKELDVDGTVRAWSEEAERQGDLSLAQEHLQVLGGVMDLLDQTVVGLSGLELTLEQYHEVLEAGLESLRVGLVPPGMDEVLVGSVERTRQRTVRALLVLGATDRAFPHRPEEDVLLGDADRRALAEAGLALGPTSHERLLHERYLLYLTLTRASDFLWIACPLSDGEGRALTPSPLFQRLTALFPGITPRRITGDDPSEMATEDALTAALALRLGEGARDGVNPDDLALAAWARSHSRDPDRARRVLSALEYGKDFRQLDPALARSLWASPPVMSVSRLESFAGCPFQHFAMYGLGLAERPRQRLDAPGLGQLVHAVLRRIAEVMDRATLAWRDLGPDEAALLVDAAMNELAPRLQNEVLATRARYRFVELDLRRTLRSLLLRLSAHARAGSFVPVGAEVAFGPKTADRPEVTLSDGTRVLLSGRIDRIEAAEGAGRRMVRVIDFKLHARSLGLAWVYHRLALQLGVYLEVAACREARTHPGQAVAPAGLLYMPVTDAWVRVEGPVSEEDGLRRRAGVLRAQGWVLDDIEALRAMDEAVSGQLVPVRLRTDGRPYRNAKVLTAQELRGILVHVMRSAAALAEGVLRGDIRVLPYRLGDATPCAACSLHSVCRFDARLDPQRRLAAPDRDDALAFFGSLGEGARVTGT